MTVAQYEVLGHVFLKATRPGLSAVVRTTKEGQDDRQLLTPVNTYATDQEPNLSIVPGGTDISFYTHFPALRTGLLLSNVPAGPVLSAYHEALC